MQKVDKQFVSEIDKKLAKFNKSQPKSQAQLDEIEKYQRIYALRGDKNATPKASDDELWS